MLVKVLQRLKRSNLIIKSKNMRDAWNKIPNAIQVPIYVGLSSILATIIANIQNLEAIDWRAILVIVLTIGVNTLAYLIARAKE